MQNTSTFISAHKSQLHKMSKWMKINFFFLFICLYEKNEPRYDLKIIANQKSVSNSLRRVF